MWYDNIPLRARSYLLYTACLLRLQGSSAIQMVPALQPKVKKLVNYVRGKTWVATSFGVDAMEALLDLEVGDVGNREFCVHCRPGQQLYADRMGLICYCGLDHFTPEQMDRFKNEPDFFYRLRDAVTQEFNVCIRHVYSTPTPGS